MSDKVLLPVLLAALLPVAGVAAEPELGDPTRPSYLPSTGGASAPRGPVFEVESIIVSPGRRLAVINGRTVGVNDWVNSARVVEILPYEVRLEYKGETRNVTLIPTRVKRPANEW